MLKWSSMGKHYHYRYGVRRKTYRTQKFIALTICAGFIGFVTFPMLSSYTMSRNSSINLTTAVNKQVAQAGENNEDPPKIITPLPWPQYGQAAYAVPKDNLFVSSTSTEEPVPIASLAKIITVLAVLREKPLKPESQGPAITLDKYDADLVGAYARKSGTYTTVLDGQQISQYQALQSIIMVSSNNMADSLARWAFGSVDEYTVYANKMIRNFGLENTVVADDASGYSPNTKSTPEDMTKLGRLFMKNPVLREIAMQKRATIPVAGAINNNNDFMNKDGLIGIKLGNSDEAGKCFIAAEIRKNGKDEEEISIAVILGASDFYTAAKDIKTILEAGNKGHDLLPGLL